MAAGRLPDPTRPDEIFINQTLADQSDIEVGERVSIIILNPITFEVLRMTEATVTGVGSTANEVAVADVDDLQRIIFTPAFLDENPDAISGGDEDFTYYWSGLQLAPGTDVADVERAWEEQAPDRFPGRNPFRYLRTNTLHASVQQANRPQVVGLAGFGVMAALLGTALTVQVTRRVVRAARPDLAAVQGLGATWATSAAGVLLAAGLAVLLGAGMAVGLAWLLSSSAPVGLVREIEPDPGRSFDALILGIGGVGLALLGAAAAVLTARRVGRGRGGVPGRCGLCQPPAPGERVRGPDGNRTTEHRGPVGGGRRRGVHRRGRRHPRRGQRHPAPDHDPPPLRIRLRRRVRVGFGLLPVRPRRPGPVPHRTGRPRPGGLVVGHLHQRHDRRRRGARARRDPGRGAIGPTIVEGRAPAGPGEIALGEDTLDAVGADVGDEIDVEGQPFAVVGTAVLPALGQATSDHSGLGVGGWLAAEDLAVLFPDEDFVGLASALLVDLRDGADADATVDALKADLLEDLVAWGVLEADAEEAGTDILTIYRPPVPPSWSGRQARWPRRRSWPRCSDWVRSSLLASPSSPPFGGGGGSWPWSSRWGSSGARCRGSC